MTTEPTGQHHTKRDAETLFMLGTFLGILGVCVLIGTAWAANGMERAVNVVAGLVIVGIGGGMLFRSRALNKSLD